MHLSPSARESAIKLLNQREGAAGFCRYPGNGLSDRKKPAENGGGAGNRTHFLRQQEPFANRDLGPH
jgi:hypothetical protein